MATPLYVLSPRATQQMEELLSGVAAYSGQERSRLVEESLYTAFAAIAAQPGMGHLRPELVAGPVYFFYANPYMVLFRKDVPIQIVAIFHGARDLAALMLIERE